MPTPQSPGGHQPYTPLLGVVGTPQTIPDRHAVLRCWSLSLPAAAGIYDFVTPANIDVEIANIRFKRSANAGNAADSILIARGSSTIATITPSATGHSITGATDLHATNRNVSGGSTIRVTTTSGGAPASVEGVIDVYWFAD